VKLLSSSHDWTKPITTIPKPKDKMTTTYTYGLKPLACPVCHKEAKECTVRQTTFVSCSSVSCRFTLVGTSVWSWNESVREVVGLQPKAPPPPLPPSPRLTVELGVFDKIVKARVVEQTIRGFEFNEECRVKGIDSWLFSDSGPSLLATSLYVRGVKDSADSLAVSRIFETKESAKAFYDGLVGAIRAFNDGKTDGIRAFPTDEDKKEEAKPKKA